MIEMLMSLVILSMILAMALPAMASFHGNQSIDASRARLQTSFQLARKEAVMRGRTVSVCPSTDGATCLRHPDWSHGWIVFGDPNSDGIRQPGEDLIRFEQAAHKGTQIHSSPGRLRATYRATGRAVGTNMTVRFCDPQSPQAGQALVLNNGGRMRARPANAGECG